jgi:hypothetical protein
MRCRYASREQCARSASGVGGICVRNPNSARASTR